MNWPEMTDDEHAAIERIGDALAAEQHTLGPTSPLALREQEEGDDPLPTNVVLTEWVVLHMWTDLETGQTWHSMGTSPRLPGHHAQGLLHAWAT